MGARWFATFRPGLQEERCTSCMFCVTLKFEIFAVEIVAEFCRCHLFFGAVLRVMERVQDPVTEGTVPRLNDGQAPRLFQNSFAHSLNTGRVGSGCQRKQTFVLSTWAKHFCKTSKCDIVRLRELQKCVDGFCDGSSSQYVKISRICLFLPSSAHPVHRKSKVCNAIGLDGLVIIGGDAPQPNNDDSGAAPKH